MSDVERGEGMRFWQRWNTLRNQILAIYLIVLILVLFIVSFFIFNQVAGMLRENAEDQVQQTVNEAIGRYDVLYTQLNLLTRQISTNDQVQSIILKEYHGDQATFAERQALSTLTNRLQANADGIYMTEIYNYHLTKLTPLDGPGLGEQVGLDQIRRADEANGKLVWLGEDPHNKDFFLAIRQIRLLGNNFENGGYVLVRINKDYFQTHTINDDHDQMMMVLDQNERLVSSNFKEFAEQMGLVTESGYNLSSFNDDHFLHNSEISRETGWTIIMLTPITWFTEGLPVLRTIIVVAGLIGFAIFFIFSYFLSTYITKPINKLTDTMRKAGEEMVTLEPSTTAAPNEINELNQTYNQLAEQTNYLIQMVYEKELVKSRTELKALQAQINPHFLFNTLDLLYWSLDKKDEDDLAEMVLAMSHLFRYTITASETDEWVSIRDELNHIEQYMKIMQMRFGERLRYDIDVDDALLDYVLPKLIIQPLIENAVLHGIGDMVEDGVIQLTIQYNQDKDGILISVADNGKGISKEKLEKIYQNISENKGVQISGDGMALANVERRLKLYYNPNQIKGIQINSVEDKGTVIGFKIPIIKYS